MELLAFDNQPIMLNYNNYLMEKNKSGSQSDNPKRTQFASFKIGLIVTKTLVSKNIRYFHSVIEISRPNCHE